MLRTASCSALEQPSAVTGVRHPNLLQPASDKQHCHQGEQTSNVQGLEQHLAMNAQVLQHFQLCKLQCCCCSSLPTLLLLMRCSRGAAVTWPRASQQTAASTYFTCEENTVHQPCAHCGTIKSGSLAALNNNLDGATAQLGTHQDHTYDTQTVQGA